MLYVVKRDGREVEFNSDKIAQAIKGSATEIGLNFKRKSSFRYCTESNYIY